jgi:UDP-apiose/xylose synthase
LAPPPNPRIAVLGAGGFIGSHLIPALLARPEGFRVDAVDMCLDKLEARSPRVRRIEARLDAGGLLEELIARCDVFISLTALCNPALYNTQPLAVIDANYTELVPLVKLCADRGKRLIHLSTCEVYGRRALDDEGRATTEMREDETSLCLGPVHKERWSYAAAKQLLERVIWAHGKHSGLNFTLVRPFNVIGPRMDFIPGVDGEGIPRVLASFMHALLTGNDLVLVDGGKQRRSFVHVDEFVDALLRIIARPEVCRGEILNLGNPRNDVTIRGLARAIVGAFRSRRPSGPTPRLRAVTAQNYYGDGYDDSIVRIPSIAKAERLLDWHPQIPLKAMLPGIVDDYIARYEPLLADRAPLRAIGEGGAR